MKPQLARVQAASVLGEGRWKPYSESATCRPTPSDKPAGTSDALLQHAGDTFEGALAHSSGAGLTLDRVGRIATRRSGQPVAAKARGHRQGRYTEPGRETSRAQIRIEQCDASAD